MIFFKNIMASIVIDNKVDSNVFTVQDDFLALEHQASYSTIFLIHVFGLFYPFVYNNERKETLHFKLYIIYSMLLNTTTTWTVKYILHKIIHTANQL
jgi:hypothetical protein